MKYHMRRHDKEITDDATLKKILKTTQYVTLAMVKDNEPYLVSLSHGYDDENHCIYFHSAKEGKKLDYMRANAVVWGQAMLDHGYIEVECTHNYASVMFSGKVHFIEGKEERWRAISTMNRQLDPNAEEMIIKRKPESLDQAVFGKIVIDHWTGKKSEEITV
jgi:nitroimidazol reductase NimA-like FMN-containing flavoprotein (pyridoxamine 5'-phosphate oxidase superfamily)